MRNIGIMMMCCLSFTGCSLYSVTKGDVGTKGIPILVKQPVAYQMTKVALTHWKITYTLKAGGKVVATHQGVTEVVASKEAQAALVRIGDGLAASSGLTAGNFAERVESGLLGAAVNWNGCKQDEPPGVVCVLPSDGYGRTIENTRVVVSELSEAQHYINTRRPWIGKASATIALAADGTMTSAQAEVEDKTAETILSVLPVTSFFTKQWNLAAAAASAAATAMDWSESRDAKRFAGALRPAWTVELKLEPVTWIYVLRRRLGGQEIGPALTYPDKTCGTPGHHCVQLVSASKAEDAKAPQEKKPAGWTISGSVVPPAKE